MLALDGGQKIFVMLIPSLGGLSNYNRPIKKNLYSLEFREVMGDLNEAENTRDTRNCSLIVTHWNLD